MKARRIFAGLLLAVPSAASPAAPALPGADALLAAALSAPATGYVAQGRIQAFEPGGRAKALILTEYHASDGRFRREIRRSPGRPAETTFVDDGARTRLYWPKLGTEWSGASSPETGAEDAARLRALYAISVSTGGRVAGRATWRLSFTAPGGGLRRALWVDRASGVPLKCEEYRLDGTLSRRERFTALEFVAADAGLFRLDVPPSVSTAPMTAPRGAADPGTAYPGWIPDGFLALSQRADGRTRTVEYGDGVASFTLVESESAEAGSSGRRVRLKDGRVARLSPGEGVPSLWFVSRGRAFRVTGEITEDEMVRLADSLP